MRLKALLVADHASVDASGKIYVNGGGITRLTTPLPGILPFLSLLALFVVDEDDLHQEHSAQIRISGPDGSQLADLPEHKIGPLERKAEPYEDQYFTIVVTVGGLPLAKAGRYTFELRVDDKPAGEVSVAVIQAPHD